MIDKAVLYNFFKVNKDTCVRFLQTNEKAFRLKTRKQYRNRHILFQTITKDLENLIHQRT